MKTLAALVVLTALLVGCAPVRDGWTGDPPSSPPTVSAALRRDAESMAEDLGIPIEDAVQRLQYQDGIGELRAALAAEEGATFAGLWIEHEPEYRIVVAFTRGGKRTVRRYINDEPWADQVEVRSAEVALSELETALHETIRATGRLDYPVMVALNEMENRVEVMVSGREWFEEELRGPGIELPENVVLVDVPGPSPREIDVCADTPVPGVAFPRQAPVVAAVMEAELAGPLVLVDGGLRVDSIHDRGSYLPIWPPEFILAKEGNAIVVLDGAGVIVARVGEEVYMGGGTGSLEAVPQCVREQLPQECGEQVWIVGEGVRPNFRRDSDLFSLDVISGTGRSFVLLRKKPVLDEWAEGSDTFSGTLVLWEGQRCPRVWSERGGDYLPLWPAEYSVRMDVDGIEFVDGSGESFARVGDAVTLHGGPIPGDWESDQYRQLYYELPGDCHGPYWIVVE